MALLGNLKGSAHVFPETGFYNEVATQSLRFDSARSTVLSKTPNASNLKTWTWSAWVKRTKLGVERAIWSVGASDVDFALFFHHTTDELRVWTTSGAAVYYTARAFRDINAWYHIAITSNNVSPYIRLYINGELNTESSYDNRTNVPGTSNLSVNTNAIHRIGAWYNGSLQYFDGYLADVNHIDGTAVGDTNGVLDEFIEIKNGVCIPKKYTGSYGTNGYRLEFKQTGLGSGSSSTIGADTSGNNNHYDSSGIVASDCAMPDSPENNFTTLNSTYGNLSVTLSEGNLKYTTGTSVNPVTGTISIPTTGKWYWEVYVSAVGDAMIGVQNRPDQQANGYSGRKTVYYRQGGSGGGSGSIYIEGSGNGGSQASYTNGDVVSVLYNADDMKIAWYKNGSQEGLTFDVTDTDVMPIVYQASGSGSTSGTFNFGQDSTFAGTISAGGNTDANGIGDFKYTVPSGYLALCSDNLPEPTIGPDSVTLSTDHFNTVLYTGNATDDRAVTGVGFQPDWIWIKNRTSSFTHVLVDSSRGLSAGYIASSTSNAESGDASLVKTITSDGFTLGTSGAVNGNSASLVSWNWKANGGTTSSNTDGSITSTVQANTTAGFSIVLHTGTGSASTIGHGLGVAPDWIITKGRTNTNHWTVLHSELGATKFIDLNQVNASDTSTSVWNDTNPTSTVFSVGTNSRINGSGVTYVSYCFAEVEGYSKFGSVIGNGSTDGAFVYTGFRPAWIMVKCTTTTNDWFIYDIVRDTSNVVENILAPNLSNAESGVNTSVRNLDILSNGFKARGSDGFNLSGQTHIYMAFAEQPFKFANAR